MLQSCPASALRSVKTFLAAALPSLEPLKASSRAWSASDSPA